MDWLELPSREEWERRRCWFEELNESAAGEGSYLVSEQACALIGEVQTVFCAGAWLAVIVLSVAVVDAQVREYELPDFRRSTKRLLEDIGAEALQRVRRRRNALVHIDPVNPAITVDKQWSGRADLEAEAREAVKLMFDVFYMSPGT